MSEIKGVMAKDLQLGDVVNLSSFMDYNTCTVKQIKDGLITFFRPYVHTDDFTHTGGVTCYVGIETFSVMADSLGTFNLLRRVTLR